MHKALFLDKINEEKFRTEGYAIIDFLSNSEVEELKSFYHNLDNNHINPQYHFHVSMDNENAKFREKVSAKINACIEPKLNDFFENSKIFTSSFVAKESGVAGLVPPHQDWTFVDEDTFDSVTCWIALMDVSIENGAIGLIKGSHNFFDKNTKRPSPAPQTPSSIGDFTFELLPYIEIEPLKAGQAIVFNNRTVHASLPNNHPETRLAAGIGITQKEANLYHYFLNPESDGQEIIRYKIDDVFFQNYNNQSLSKLYNEGKVPELLEEDARFPFEYQALNKDEILALIQEKNLPINETVAQAMSAFKDIFGGIQQNGEYGNSSDEKNEETSNLNTNSEQNSGGFFKKLLSFFR